MPQFARTAAEQQVGPVHLVSYRIESPSIVSIDGSVDLHPDVAAGEEMVASVAAGLLDKGTARRDRFEIAAELEDCGARRAYAASGLKLEFSATCLAEDLERVLGIIGEELCEPAFEETELEKVRSRFLGGIRRQMDDTGFRSSACLAQHLYGPGHPNHVADPSDQEAWLIAVDAPVVRSFHEASFRGTGVRAAVVGAVEPMRVEQAITRAFAGWNRESSRSVAYPDPPAGGPGRRVFKIADRPNLDVRIGHSLRLRRGDDEYEALRLATFVLGGNFSARLMSRVRDEKGLTYGISSALSGVHTRHSGAWRTSVTLSAERLEEGLEATMAELAAFVSEGATDEEVAAARETLAGRFSVSLATSEGMSGALLRTLERGESLAHLDDYPGRTRALTAGAVNAAAARHLDPTRLFVAVAGSVTSPG